MLIVATDRALTDLDTGTRLALGAVTDVAVQQSVAVALVDRCRVVRVGPAGAETLGVLEAADGQSITIDRDGHPVVGLAGARLARLVAGAWEPLTAFEAVPGRDDWENPAAPTPDLRTLAVGAKGRLFANVHVGGVWFTDDGGLTWHDVVEPGADVHEVTADDDGRVAVAAAVGFGWSTDAGLTWTWTTAGLHASYLRAVATEGDRVLVSASTGPRTDRAAVYRAHLGEPFTRCTDGLPDWLGANVDSRNLALGDGRGAIGTEDGQVFVSDDGGTTWQTAATNLGAVRAVALADRLSGP